MMLDCAASLLARNGVLWLAGENKAGIKSADKLLKTHFRKVRKLDNARHCSLFEACAHIYQDAFNPWTTASNGYWIATAAGWRFYPTRGFSHMAGLMTALRYYWKRFHQ